jgi:RND family efflux transporter MFP subunit
MMVSLVAGGVVALAGILIVGLNYNPRGEAARADKTGRRVLYYRDPMHPAYTSSQPGKAPDCGMDLEPIYRDPTLPAPHAVSADENGSITVSSDRQQLIGMRLGRVETSSTTHIARVLGRVAPDEARIFPVTTGSDGWVTQIFSGGTGSSVQRGQPLVEVFGREYTTAQRTYLYALRSFENSPPVAPGDYQDQPAVVLQEARLNLISMGMGEAQIQQITQSRKVLLKITLTAPASGVIISRNVFSEQKFSRGAELFRIADLSHVWIIADFFGEEARYLRSGVTAKVSAPGRPGTTFRAIVSEALSTFDSVSRSLKVRFDAANPNLILRPGMFVDVQFTITLPPAKVVPAEAIVESGMEQVVFVNRGKGTFESRRVETGWRFGDRVQIVRGLENGETIVVSGSFLLNSESRIQRGDLRPHD